MLYSFACEVIKKNISSANRVNFRYHLFTECVLPLKPDWSFYSPLIFTLNGTLITTENHDDKVEDITLKEGVEVLLSCTPNYFRDIPAEKTLRAVCKEEKMLGKF